MGRLANPTKRLGALQDECGDVPLPRLGQPFRQPEKPAALALLYNGKGPIHNLHAPLDLSPGAFGEGAAHGQEGFPLLAHVCKDILPQHQALAGDVVGLVGQGLRQGQEHLYIPERQVPHQARAYFKETGSQGAGFPSTLVQATSEAGPAGDILGSKVGCDPRAGLEICNSQGWGVLGQVGAAPRPLHEGGEGKGLGNLGTGAEVLQGRFPRPHGLVCDGQAFLSPQVQLFFIEGGGQLRSRAAEFLHHRGRHLCQLSFHHQAG